MIDSTRADSFANKILPDWQTAVDQFFRRVEAKSVALGLTADEVFAALDAGYGDVVADSWREWLEG